MRRILLLSPLVLLLTGLSPRAVSQEGAGKAAGRAKITAFDLLPRSTWALLRMPAPARLVRSLETHPLWSLYCRGERGASLAELGDRLARAVREGSLPGTGLVPWEEIGRTLRPFLRGWDQALSGDLRPRFCWMGFTSFGITGGAGRFRGRKRWSGAYDAVTALLLEYPQGREDLARRAGKALEDLLGSLSGGKGSPWGPLERRRYKGLEFFTLSPRLRGRTLGSLHLARMGRFLVACGGAPWALFQAWNTYTGRTPSLGKGKAPLSLLEGPDSQVRFALDPRLLPERWIPEPLPLIWRDLGLPRLGWIQGWWDPATGRTGLFLQGKAPARGILGKLAAKADPDGLARFLPADTAAFALVPFDWKALARPLEPYLEEAERRGLLPPGITAKEIASGFEGVSLESSPLPVLSGLEEMGLVFRFHEGLPVPEIAAAFRMDPAFLGRLRAFVEEKAGRWPRLRVTEIRGTRVYRWSGFMEIAFVFHKGWVFAAPPGEMVRTFLPVFRGKKASLAERKIYRDCRSRFPREGCLAFCYVNGPEAVAEGESLARGLSLVLGANPLFRGLGGLFDHDREELEAVLSGYGSGLYFGKDGISYRSDLPFSPFNLLAFLDAGAAAWAGRLLFPREEDGPGAGR